MTCTVAAPVTLSLPACSARGRRERGCHRCSAGGGCGRPLAAVVAARGVERLVSGARPGWEALVGGPATAVNPWTTGRGRGGGGNNAAGARPRGNGLHRALRHLRDRDRGVAGQASPPTAAPLTLESAVSFWALARTRLAAVKSRREARMLAGELGAERGEGSLSSGLAGPANRSLVVRDEVGRVLQGWRFNQFVPTRRAGPHRHRSMQRGSGRLPLHACSGCLTTRSPPTGRQRAESSLPQIERQPGPLHRPADLPFNLADQSRRSSAAPRPEAAQIATAAAAAAASVAILVALGWHCNLLPLRTANALFAAGNAHWGSSPPFPRPVHPSTPGTLTSPCSRPAPARAARRCRRRQSGPPAGRHQEGAGLR